MHLGILFLVVAVSAKVRFTEVNPPVIRTPYGPIQGRTYKTSSGINVNLFLGVPYAKPPTKEARFEKATLPDAWDDGKAILADQYGDGCHVHHRGVQGNDYYSEDCLVINIVTPKEMNQTYPILIYIHGGGFEIGSIQDVGYKQASENFVTKGIIFVTIQYRLGFLGFMTNGASSLPGNLGLWDQVLALEFIHKVLPSFGGDVNRITLMGNSAGSASISALLASPHSNQLFLQTIQLSGSIFCPWAYGENVIEVSLRLSQAVGCDFKDNSMLMDCLKNKTIDQLFDGMKIVGLDKHHPEFMILHPHLDYDFFPEPVETLLAKAPKKTTIQGLTDNESGILTYTLDIPIGGFYITPEKRKTFSRNDLKNFIETITADMGSDGAKITELAMGVYGNTTNETNHAFFMQAYTDVLSDLQFNLPVLRELEIKRKNHWNTYSYIIKHSRRPGVPGATHGEELPYMIEYYGGEKKPLRDEDKEFKRILLESFISFIKTGKPAADKVTWKPISDTEPGVHLILTPKPKVEEKPYHEEAYHLWLETIPSQVNKKILRDKLFPGL